MKKFAFLKKFPAQNGSNPKQPRQTKLSQYRVFNKANSERLKWSQQNSGKTRVSVQNLHFFILLDGLFLLLEAVRG